MEDILSLLKDPENMKALEEGLLKGKDNVSIVLVLKRIFKSDNQVDIRWRALRMIHKLDSGNLKEFLLENILDYEPDIRTEICGLLSNYSQDEDISRALVDRLLYDADLDVRLLAVFSLGKVGTINAVSTLEDVGKRDHAQNWETRRVSEYTSGAIQEIKNRNNLMNNLI